jgi:hypothetical protein
MEQITLLGRPGDHFVSRTMRAATHFTEEPTDHFEETDRPLLRKAN